MKRDTAMYVDTCLIYQTVKDKHQWPVGELRLLETPTWKGDSILIDLVKALTLTTLRNSAIG